MSDCYTIVIPVKVNDRELELHVNVWANDAQDAVDQLAENLRELEDHLHPYPDSQR